MGGWITHPAFIIICLKDKGFVNFKFQKHLFEITAYKNILKQSGQYKKHRFNKEYQRFITYYQGSKK